MHDWIFFYIMVMSHNNKVGFGITKNPERVDDYTAHCLEDQRFKFLFYGPEDEIEDIEDAFKQKHRKILIKKLKRKKWRLEGIDPKESSMSAEDVKLWVEKFIAGNTFKTQRIQDNWLPYGGDKRLSRKNITISPELYLETVK
jgi:hypothetical protein